ncbi:MAG: T9SS type B sorting domain-containing protein, partial [Chitinophagales bacterium]
CFGADDGSITFYISGGTAPYSYMGNLIPNDSITINDLPPGFFSGNIEDANGCTFFVSQTISEPAHIAITETHIDASCFGISDGSIDITVFGGISPYSFEWSDTVYTEDRNNLSAGTYNLTIIDSNSCEDSISIAIDEPAEVPLTIDVTDADCFGDLGSATAIPSEGSGPYDFQWDNSSENSATVALINGNHNVTATSSEGCEQTATFTINSQPQIILQASTNNPDCYGDTSGAITLNVSGGVGGFSYNWTPPVSNAENASNLPAGEYQIQITDQNNCSEDTTIHIIAPEELDVVSTAENETCFDANDGSININSNGGTAPYTYNWNDGTSETIRENLAPGVYSLTITDANGCSTIIIDSIEAALPIWVSTDSSVYTIYEGQQIEINSESFTDGKNILAYDWQPITGLDCPDCESVTAAPVESETYTLSIVDEAGCTADTTFEIIVLNEQVFYAPSVFTPNGDGINDGYGIKAEGVINFKFQIFDRWGTLIFETNDINEEWDGTYKGKLLPPDVFVYKAYADFLDKS